jgi:thiamine-phosphate diphosphorylase
MSPADARLLLGRTALIGLSLSTVQHAREAPLDLVDYVGIGAVYPTGSKDNATTPIGVSGLREIVQVVRARKPGFPVCAISGINAANASETIAAGADGVAVISALSRAPDPGKAARELRAVVDEALRRRGQS